MKTLMWSCALGVMCALGSGQDVAAATLEFEGVAPDNGILNVSPAEPYAENGFTITPSNADSAVFDTTSSVSMPGNDTSFLGFSGTNSLVLTVSSGPGNVFNLLGLDAGVISLSEPQDITLTIAGSQAGGGTLSFTSDPLSTLTILTLNWTDLTKVTFSANDDAGLDNINVSASEISVVPLPAALPLLLAALGGLFVMRRSTPVA